MFSHTLYCLQSSFWYCYLWPYRPLLLLCAAPCWPLEALIWQWKRASPTIGDALWKSSWNLCLLIMSSPTLVDSVRNWVHFDNLCIMLSRQIATARNMRATFEDRVLSLLGSTKRLRIKGALLEPAVKKTNINLNWTTLEESLHKYFDSVKKPD